MAPFQLNRLRHSRLRVQQMELVLQLIELGSISAAAQAMGLTQSAVTRSLQELESLLGVELFVRAHHGVVPTALCRPVEKLARDFRYGLEETSREIRHLISEKHHSIKIGAETGEPMRLLSRALAAMRKHSTPLSATVISAPAKVLMEMLQNGKIDLFVGRVDMESDDDDQHIICPLSSQRLNILANAGHPALSDGPIEPAAAADQLWVLPPPGHAITHRLELAFSQIGVAPPARRLVTESVLCIFEFLTEMDMLTVVDEYQAERLLAYGGLASVVAEGLELTAVPICSMYRRHDRSTESIGELNQRLLHEIEQPRGRMAAVPAV